MIADVRAEKPANIEPRPTAQQGAADRQDKSCVAHPPPTPEPLRRNRKLQAGHHPARSNDASQLGNGRGRVGHVAEQVGERDRIKGAIVERKVLTLPSYEADAILPVGRDHVAMPSGKHVRAQVDSRDRGTGSIGQLQGDAGRSGGNIEDRRRTRRHDVVDHLPPPASVLTKRQHGRQPVVVSGQTGEQRFGERCR